MRDYSKYYIKKYVADFEFHVLNIPKINKTLMPDLGEFIICKNDTYKVKSICYKMKVI